MIEELNVRNFALIDNINLQLENGFSVLTGETGAGKSIIVGSLSFLLGSKADTEVIRSGCDEAAVSATVSVNAQNRDAITWLSDRDIAAEDSRLIIRRTVKSNGRGSVYIQNVPVTRAELSEFMSCLFDLHGQHSHESLLRKETHRVYLDRFSGLEDEALELNRVFLELAEKNKALEALNNSERDREGRLDLLNYAVEEISKAKIKPGEMKELEAETQRLGDFEKLSLHVNNGASALFDDEVSFLSLARRSRTSLENAAAIDGSLSPFLKRMEDIYYEAEDIAAEFRDYRNSLSYNQARLEEAEERLVLLNRLKKKYRPQSSSTPDEEGILSYMNEALAEIETLSNAGENRDKIKSEISFLEKDLISRASALSAKRTEGASRLSKGITEILARLGMPKAAFSVQVRPKTSGKSSGENPVPGKTSEKSIVCGPWGADDVEFMISANTGEPLKELARIASGGELSRVMLAIKTILFGKAGGDGAYAETLVFDEVDTGIGGEVALSVGEYLSRIGKGKQIFCVTHLASIAVQADNHFMVEKKIISGRESSGIADRTVTEVSLLDSKERRQEIARMLAGDSGSAALAHADELLAKYGAGVSHV